MIDGRHISSPSPLFVRQVGARLKQARRVTRRPLWHLARASRGAFSASMLRDAEAGLLPLDAGTVADLAALYGVDVTVFLPSREEGLQIDPEGCISAGGRSVPFEPGDSVALIAAYFTLVRGLRDVSEHHPIPLRKTDVSIIAEYLGEQGERSQLLEAMVAVADAQRRVTVSSLLVGAASAGLIDLPSDSVVHRNEKEHQDALRPRSIQHPAVMAQALEQGI